MARFDAEQAPTEEQRAYNTKAMADAIRRVRDAGLNALTTEGSPAEWLAQKVAPGFKSTNAAGIYARNPDAAGLAGAMAGGIKVASPSPEFAQWFGKSKVVDEAGKPLVLFHGSARDLPVIEGGKGGRPGLHSEGIWFTPSPREASQYADMAEGAAPNVSPVHLSIHNPATVYQQELNDVTVAGLRAKGHDGAFDAQTGAWIAFDPSQVKSAIGNRGTFDPSDPNITHALPPIVGAAGLADAIRRRGRSDQE